MQASQVNAPQEQLSQESKSKKSKKSKKKEAPAPAEAGSVPAEVKPVKEPKKKLSKDDTKEEDVSVKTDSGIVDEPASESAAKKKSKSKKQREKKAAAAALAAQQPPSDTPATPKEKIVIDLTPASAAANVAATTAKPKDKKKKPKADQKTREDTDKVQDRLELAFSSLVYGFVHISFHSFFCSPTAQSFVAHTFCFSVFFA